MARGYSSPTDTGPSHEGSGPGEPAGKKNCKTRITINLDRDIIDYFKFRGVEAAKGYQTLINEALRDYIGLTQHNKVLADLLERVKRLEQRLSK